MSQLISIKELNIQFQTEHGKAHVIKDVSFSIPFGETFGLVGESGCGKSVTSRSLMQLIPYPGRITKGEILFFKEETSEYIDITKTSEKEMQHIRGQEIGMIFQEPDSALNPIMSVGDQITETLYIQNKISRKNRFFDNPIKHMQRKKEFWDKAITLLKQLEISDPESVANRYPHQLSGGMKQRILIAIALAGSPSLLISDESTSSLDVTVQSQIILLLDQLKKNRIIQSILFITHDLGLASIFCNRVGVMYSGCMCEIGLASDIFQNPLHPYTYSLLATIPRKSIQNKLSPIQGQVPDLLNSPQGCRFHPRCYRVTKKCKIETPDLKSIDSDRMVACWNML